MIELTRNDWSPGQKATFQGFTNRVGAKVDDSWKYDEWCRKAREAGRELRARARLEGSDSE